MPILSSVRKALLTATATATATASVMVLALLSVSVERATAQGSGDNPPVLWTVAVTPKSFDHHGGEVMVTADVLDDFGIAMMYADVISRGMYEPAVQMYYAGQTGDVLHYKGYTLLPPNSTDEPVSYGFVVTATDTNGGFDYEEAGEVEVAAQPQFDEAPIVSDATVTPPKMPSIGGAVTIRAAASDNRGLSEVYADVSEVGGSGSWNVPLNGVSSSHFEGVFDAPPNTGPDPVQYRVQIVALDDIGQPGTLDAGLFIVVPRSTALLAAWPESHTFGSVKLGARGFRTLYLLIRGGQKGAPVDATLTASDPRFFIAQPGVSSANVRVFSGYTKRVQIGFKPTAAGLVAGLLTVHRPDGAEADRTIKLYGRGAKNK